MRSTPYVAAAIVAAALAAFALGAPAQQTPAARHVAITEKLNQNTVTVISGNPNGAYLYLAYDMSAVLDDGNELRVLPVIGKGGYQNVLDVLHLRGVDWASRSRTS
jgi:uncharacterized protein